MNTRSNIQEHLSWLISSRAFLSNSPLPPVVIPDHTQTTSKFNHTHSQQPLLRASSYAGVDTRLSSITVPINIPSITPIPSIPFTRITTPPASASADLIAVSETKQKQRLPAPACQQPERSFYTAKLEPGDDAMSLIVSDNTLPSSDPPIPDRPIQVSAAISQLQPHGSDTMARLRSSGTPSTLSRLAISTTGSNNPLAQSTSSLPSSSNESKTLLDLPSRLITPKASTSNHLPSTTRAFSTPRHSIAAIDLSGGRPAPLASSAFDNDPRLSGNPLNKRKGECTGTTPPSLSKRPRGDITEVDLDTRPPSPYVPPPGGDFIDFGNIDEILDEDITSDGPFGHFPTENGFDPAEYDEDPIEPLTSPSKNRLHNYPPTRIHEAVILQSEPLGPPDISPIASSTQLIFDSEDEADLGQSIMDMKTLATNTTVQPSIHRSGSKQPSFPKSNYPAQRPHPQSYTAQGPGNGNNHIVALEEQIGQLIAQAEQARKTAASKASEYIQKYSDVSMELQGQLMSEKKKVDTLDTLRQLVFDFKTWSQQKLALENQIMTGVREGKDKRDLFGLLDRNTDLHQKLQGVTKQGSILLEQSGLPSNALQRISQLDSPPVSIAREDVVVKSTQESHLDSRQLPTTRQQLNGYSDVNAAGVRHVDSPLLINSSPAYAGTPPFQPDRHSVFNLENSFVPHMNLDEVSEVEYTERPSNFGAQNFTNSYNHPAQMGFKEETPVTPLPLPSLPRPVVIPLPAAVTRLAPPTASNRSSVDSFDPANSQSRYSPKKAVATTTNSKYANMNFPWSEEVNSAVKNKFKMTGFRPNQLEAINTTLSGRDVFVLMPTGGGKSLCYQVPAIVRAGQRGGVTMVVSPLLSLMEDQVMHLRNRGIKAFILSGEVPKAEKTEIYSHLHSPDPFSQIQLLYITPEMLTKNLTILDVLKQLHRDNHLARIVIDEAHCVSQWGHDFRPDYKAIGGMRSEFPGVPLMALTATATAEVEGDVMHNLSMTNCEIFRQSFNRPNLYYEVRKKGTANSMLESIAAIIKEEHRGQCGIIYCLSRNQCESVAEKLRVEHNVAAQHYHAGMETEEKRRAQLGWQKGRSQVIVATIAFGMGIDKADVRFVIHHTIPKSLEGYYQETGRAGRDGRMSTCILFYSFADFPSLKRMIDSSADEQYRVAKTREDKQLSRDQKERQLRNLRCVVQFCENHRDCRRVQVLEYFGESFMPELCRETCDNCRSHVDYEEINMIEHARKIVSLLDRLQHDNVGLTHCIDAYRGSKAKAMLSRNHDNFPNFGAGKELDRDVVERLFRKMFREGFIQEVNVVNKSGFPHQYVVLPKTAQRTVSQMESFILDVEIKSSKKAGAKAKGKQPAEPNELPLSTNIASPGRTRAKRNMNEANGVTRPSRQRRNMVVAQDEDSDGDEAFAPIRSDAQPARASARSSVQPNRRSANPNTLGEPISVDEKMSHLNQTHQDVIESFLQAGRNLGRELLIEHDLRSAPFSDTILREMAISFPQNVTQLLAIPGIDAPKVEAFGSLFLPLIDQYRSFYAGAMSTANNRNGLGGFLDDDQLIQDDDDDYADELIPYDPNHQNVINLESSDDGEGIMLDMDHDQGGESDYGTWSDLEEGDILESVNPGGLSFGDGSNTRSSYFDPPNHNNQYQPSNGNNNFVPTSNFQTHQPHNMAPTTSRASRAPRAPRTRRESAGTGSSSSRARGSRRGGRGSRTSISGGGGGASSGGVADSAGLSGVRKGAMNRFAYSAGSGAGASASAGAGSRGGRGRGAGAAGKRFGGGGGGRGGGGAGSIGAMPT